MMRGLCLLSCVAGLSACSPAPSSDLFPLEAGHRWTYRVTTQAEDGVTERETQTMQTLGRESLPSGGEAWRRRSDSGVDYWLRADASGVYRVASKSDLEDEPRPDKPQRFVLKAPYVVGTQWQASTAPYLLMRRNDFPRELRHTHPNVPMAYQIDAVEQAVDTPAGRFAHCLRVRGSGVLRVYADPASGWRDMPLTTVEWYCPGVGLVRVERSEPARSAFLIGGTRTLELESWQ
jgi:hypothetical protein